MMSMKNLKSSLAILMIMTLVLAPFTGNAAATTQITNNNAISISMNESLKVEPALKIKSEVSNALSTGKFVEVLVTMNEQVDTVKVARETEAALSAKTPYHKKMAGRYAVVDKLQRTAEKTQEKILKLLETEKRKGNVQEYRSFYIVNVVYVKATEDVIKKISKYSEVAEIGMNKKIEVDWPKIASASINENQVQSTEWGIDKVGAPAVWNGFGIDGAGVVVGVIDTGVDYTHEALMTKWRGYNPADPSSPNPEGNWFDAVNGQSLPYDIPSIPHGTHVTGTILGQDPDGENVIGVAPGAQFITAKAFSEDGGYDNWLLAAGEWMLAPGGDASKAPDIINNSWGGGSGMDEWYREMVQTWRAAGILPVFSAGNQDGGAAPPASVSSPANYPESFAVGATDKNNLRGSFSQLGPSPYAAPDDLKPDIAAPGVNVRSSVPGGYESGWSGTSMAAPHISGTAALLLSYNAALAPDELEQIITSTATPLTDTDYPTAPNYGYGHGLVNAFNAVSSVASGIGTIQGKVLEPGIDSLKAEIIHEQTVTEALGNTDIPITATVKDDVAVGNVEIYARNSAVPYWVVVPMNRTSGDCKEGVYTATIPYMFVQDPVTEYKIRAYDYGNNITETEIYSIAVTFGILPDFSTDFTEYPEGWIMTGDWEWGETTMPVNPSGKLVATVLNGNYSADTESWFISPPIDVRNTAATLSLRHLYFTEQRWDFAYVYTTYDGGETWEQVYKLHGTIPSGTWEDLSINLRQSQTPVYVAFMLDSDVSVTKDGWYLDDFNLSPAATASKAALGVVKAKAPESYIGKDGMIDAPKLGKVHKDASEYNYYILKNEINVEQGLPLDAVVTIVETGRSVRTNPANGSYKITHAATEEGQNWTLLAESYGFFPQEKSTTLENGSTINMDFFMEEMPTGSVSGQVVNERSNEPISGAVVQVIEDTHVQPVTTDENGYYQIPEIYEGQYTLKVSAADYKPAELPLNVVGGENSELNVQLKPFIGLDDELGYDDGTAENAQALVDGGNGWAVRMTPNELCQVKGARAFFWGEDWPTPGGNKTIIAVYDTLENGDPGQEIFRTAPIEIVRGEWNDIDLSQYGFSTDRDFYLAAIQIDDYPNIAGMGMDESSSAGRSYAVIDGGFQLLDQSYGNVMLRAKITRELTSPVITSPVNGVFTTGENVDVVGTVGTDSLVKVYVNNQVAGEAQSTDKAFTINVPLAEGENTIQATATVVTGESNPSELITVTRDTIAPVLEVSSPADGLVTNKEVVDVAGIATDTYLDNVTINGNPVQVAQDGSFSTRIIVNEGVNVLTITATDKVGHSVTETRTVNVGLALPTITDIMPNTDLTVRAGEVVTVSFHSDAIHGAAFFRILLPMDNTIKLQATGHRMNEVSDGYYVGEWNVPENVSVANAVVEVEITNTAENKSTAEADGRITVVIDEMPPELIPDTEGNEIGQDITITFEDNTEWINAISDVLVNGEAVAENYTVESGRIIINGSIFDTPGDYEIVVVADGYKDAAVTQTIIDEVLLTPPELTTVGTRVGKQVILKFKDDKAWRPAITDITVDGESISGLYKVAKGKITINAKAFSAAGTYTIAVKADGYEDAVAEQIITPKK